MALRGAAIEAMGGRKWYEGPVGLRLLYMGPKEGMSSGLLPYLDGIMDTLDGCQGPSIMYLPIAYLDDCQVVKTTSHGPPQTPSPMSLRSSFSGSHSLERTE